MKVEVLYARLGREEAKKTHHRGAKDTKDLSLWRWMRKEILCVLCASVVEMVKRKTGTLRMPVQSSQRQRCCGRLR
jgi:hypothetical protein